LHTIRADIADACSVVAVPAAGASFGGPDQEKPEVSEAFIPSTAAFQLVVPFNATWKVS
jgi:hypothetical protein